MLAARSLWERDASSYCLQRGCMWRHLRFELLFMYLSEPYENFGLANELVSLAAIIGSISHPG